MAGIAIAVLWWLVGVVVIIGVLWVVRWALGLMKVPIPDMAFNAVMIIVVLVSLIFLISILFGGGGGFTFGNGGPGPMIR